MTSPPPDLGPQRADYGGLFALPAPPAERSVAVPERSVAACVTEPRHLARRSDPDTSWLGAAHAAAHLSVLQTRTLVAVHCNPGLTATELAREAVEGDPRVFNRRLGELDRAGRVVRGAARRCRVTGRQAATWTAAE